MAAEELLERYIEMGAVFALLSRGAQERLLTRIALTYQKEQGFTDEDLRRMPQVSLKEVDARHMTTAQIARIASDAPYLRFRRELLRSALSAIHRPKKSRGKKSK